MNISEPPPKNPEYIVPFNILLEECWKRGIGPEIKPKQNGESVQQSDLDNIRRAILTEYDFFFVPDQLKLEKADPFTEAEAHPKFNDGKGFLLMPDIYTSTGRAIFKFDVLQPMGESVPLLFQHLQDLGTILKSLRFRRFDYRLDFRIYRNKLVVKTDLIRGELDKAEQDSDFRQNENRIFDTRTIRYKAIPLGKGATETLHGFYFRSDEGSWKKLSAEDIPASSLEKIDIDVSKLAECVQYATAGEWSGSCEFQPFVEIISDFEIKPPKYEVIDDESNGVAAVGNCTPCCDPIANKYNYLREALGNYFCKVKVPLAMSSATTGLITGHYIWVYSCGGKEYGQYNCDTRIEERFSGEAEDESGEKSHWEFCGVRRPTGALIQFPLAGSSAGEPLNKFKYRISRTGNIHTIAFDDQVKQIFENGELKYCLLQSAGAWYRSDIPGAGVERDREAAGNYIFSSLSFVSLSFRTDARGVPSELHLAPVASHTRTGMTASPDAIDTILFGNKFEDAKEFDFADFYPPGEKPDFGIPESVYTMDFKNGSGNLIGKYIELRHDTRIMVKGFWNREEGFLLPAELSVIERTPDHSSESFLETRKTIKYGAEGRGETISRFRKQYYFNRENTVEEYRNYGTAEELRHRLTYGDNPLSGDFGRVISESGFNGDWRRCEYDENGRLVKEITPFMDSTPDEPENRHNIILYSYEPLHPDEDTAGYFTRPRTIICQALGQETGRNYRLYFADEAWEITAAAPGAAYDAPENRVSKHYSYPDGTFKGRPWKTENADGTTVITTYRELGDSLETTTESGFLPDYGSRTVSVINGRGNVVSTRTYDIETGLLISGGDSTYDQYGRVLTRTDIDGQTTVTEYNCCGPRFVTQPDGSITEYAYDVFNRLKFENYAGITTWHAYDADNNEIRTTVTGKEGGELITLREYDTDGKLIREVNPAGAETHYARGSGWEQVTDALGGIQRTEYYRDGNRKSISGTAAFPSEFLYGVESNELTSKQLTPPSGWVENFTNFLGQQYKTLYSDGFAETSRFDAFGRPVANENTDGQKRLTIYDPASGKEKYQVLKRSNNSDEIDWQHDSVTLFDSGYVEREGKVYGYSENSLYLGGAFTPVSRSENRRDGKKTIRTSEGRTETRLTVFEGNGLVRTVSTAFDGTIQTEESENGLLLCSRHSVLGETTYAYDQFNRRISSDHAANGTTITRCVTLDALGNILTQTESGGGSERTTSYVWDQLGRQVSTTTPEGIKTFFAYTLRGELTAMSGGVYRQAYEYDVQGRQVKLTVWRNTDAPEVTRFEYDDRGRRIRKIYADNTSESWSWRGDGRVASHTNVRGRTLTYHYNLSGELTALDGAGQRIEYDNSGRITQLTDRAGTRSFTYDRYGKVLTETVPGLPGKLIGWSYDDHQRLTGLALSGIRRLFLCFSEDEIRCVRRISETDTSVTFEFAMGAWEDRETLAYQPLNTFCEWNGVRYDDYGRPEGSPDFNIKKKAPAICLIEEIPASENLKIRYRYGEEDGRMQTLETGGSILNYTYLSGNDQVKSRAWLNGNGLPFLELKYAYDKYLRLTRIDRGETTVISYVLDNDNQRKQATLSDGSVWNYSYDSLSQLTGAARGEINAMSYAYDGIGNRLTAEEDGTATVYTSNDLNQYTRVNTEEPSYDADGNMLTWNGWSYTWNDENRLVAAEKGALRFEADYDYMGRRFEKKIRRDGVLTKYEKYVYDGYKLIAIYDALNDNALQAAFTWQPIGLDVPLTMTYREETFYYVTDGNKNVVAMTDSSGNHITEYTYAPFGRLLHMEGELAEINPFRFSSEFHDNETGLVYYNYRYYSPELGRWVKRDPIEEKGDVNLYAMVGNNLIDYNDYLGLEKCICGVDISQAVDDLLNNMSLVADEHYLGRRFAHNQPNWHNPGDGWDINELFQSGKVNSSWFNGKNCGKGIDCQNTVTLWGGCYKVWAVNYILWGKLYRLAGLSREVAENYVKAYRNTKYFSKTDEDESISKGTTGRLFFTQVGYDGTKPSPDNENNYKKCEICTEQYDGTLTARIKMGSNRYYVFTNRSRRYVEEVHDTGGR